MADSSMNRNQRQVVTGTTITDLNEDSLAHCAAYLNLQDVCNLAMTCRYLKRVSYSDFIWQRFFRFFFLFAATSCMCNLSTCKSLHSIRFLLELKRHWDCSCKSGSFCRIYGLGDEQAPNFVLIFGYHVFVFNYMKRSSLNM